MKADDHAVSRVCPRGPFLTGRIPWLAATVLASVALLGSAVGPTPFAQAALPLSSSIAIIPSAPFGLTGRPIVFTAVTGSPFPLVYRFSVATSRNGPYTTVRDFSNKNTFVYAPPVEGIYYIAATVARNFVTSSTPTVSSVVPYLVFSRVTGTRDVVSPPPILSSHCSARRRVHGG
jgi:hypothetical protein